MLAGAEAFELPDEQEADQVRRAKERDAEVWALWHDQYYSLLYRYAAARLLTREDAEDVAAQVFLEAIKAIDRFQYRGRPVLAWLYGIARHLVSQRRRQAARISADSDPEASVLGPEADESLRQLALKDALERLKREQREVLVLRFLLDLPTRQVAAAIGKSEAATYSLQVRALAALRRALSE